MHDPAVNPPFVCFVAARSGTGKTTLIEKVIGALTQRKYRVATVKHVHQAQLDLPGKDSWRHREAGALAVALVAESETLLIQGNHEADPLRLLSVLPAVDIVLMEGFRNLRLPNKIEVVREVMGSEIVTRPDELAAVVTDIPGLDPKVPCFPLDDVTELVEWLEAQYLQPARAQGAKLTHFDGAGRACMVDVSGKDVTLREAVAQGEIRVKPETLTLIKDGRIAKGDVLAVAQVAAIMAVKETPRLIPMCHPVLVSEVAVAFKLNETENKIECNVKVKLAGTTGVEMEALTGVGVAMLTIYDMCKAVDQGMEIGRIRLLEKKGGRSGHFRREEP